MEWCDSSVELTDMLREEAQEQPELWEARLCCQGPGLVQLGGKDYSRDQVLSCFTFSRYILMQELCPSL